MQRPIQISCETLCQTCLPSCLSPAASLHRQRSCDLRRGCKQNLHIERQFVERRCHSRHIMCSASQTDATPVASLPVLLPLTGMTKFGLDLDHVPHSVCRLISLSLFVEFSSRRPPYRLSSLQRKLSLILRTHSLPLQTGSYQGKCFLADTPTWSLADAGEPALYFNSQLLPYFNATLWFSS